MYRSYSRVTTQKRLANLKERREAVEKQYEKLRASKRLLYLDQILELEVRLVDQLFRLDSEIERTEFDLN